MSDKSGQQALRRGASSMVSAVFISRLLGILLIVPMQNIIGEYALGLYGLAYPLYTIMLTVATAGFPIALSKSISQLTARKHYKEANQTYFIIGRSLFLFGILAFLVMWFGGPYYLSLSTPSPTIVHDAIPAIHALAPALLILPLMSAQRGFLQGNMRMEPSALSQVIEQIIRVATVLVGLFIGLSLHLSPSQMAAIATFGATTGAIGGFLLLLYAVKKLRKELHHKGRLERTPHLRSSHVLRKLGIYSLPIVLGTLVLPLSQSIDVFTIPRELIASGMSNHMATAQFGRYTQEALRLIQLPLSFATAIGSAVMPSITSALSQGQFLDAKRRQHQSLKMTAFIMLPTAVTFGFLASPIDIMLFKSASGSTLILLAAIMSLFSGLELVTTFILQGRDHFYRPVYHMAIGMILKLIGNIVLIPLLGINGAAIAGIIGYAVSSWLNMGTIRQVSDDAVSVPKLTWRIVTACIPLALWLYLLNHLVFTYALTLSSLANRWVALLAVIIGIGIGAPIYLIAAIWIKAIQPSELTTLPLIGKRIARFLQ